MTIYASRTAESLNSDPLPVLNRTTGGRHTDDGYGAMRGDDLVTAPRRSFTPKTTHPANPILVDFRKYYPSQSARSWLRVLWMPNARRRFWLGEDYSLQQIDHAKRVLTRLAAFHA